MPPGSDVPELGLFDIIVSPFSFGSTHRAFKSGMGYTLCFRVVCLSKGSGGYRTCCVPPGRGLWVGWAAFAEDLFISSLDVLCKTRRRRFYFVWGWRGLKVNMRSPRFKGAGPLLASLRVNEET